MQGFIRTIDADMWLNFFLVLMRRGISVQGWRGAL